MAGLKVKIDTMAIAKQLQGMALDIKKDLDRGVANLAAITHARVVEMASEELHSSRKSFMDNLSFEEVAEGVWVVAVDEKGLWVEEGIEPNTDMKPGLLKGKPYRVIPFDHGKAPSQLNGYAQNLVAKIRSNLKKEGVGFKKVERASNGSPLTGKLHTFPKPGAGPNEMKRWGGDIKGASIYQTVSKTGNVRRDILTFRTVSAGPASEGKWIHPGTKRHQFLDRAEIWAVEEWETKILPEILDKYGK